MKITIRGKCVNCGHLASEWQSPKDHKTYRTHFFNTGGLDCNAAPLCRCKNPIL